MYLQKLVSHVSQHECLVCRHEAVQGKQLQHHRKRTKKGISSWYEKNHRNYPRQTGLWFPLSQQKSQEYFADCLRVFASKLPQWFPLQNKMCAQIRILHHLNSKVLLLIFTAVRKKYKPNPLQLISSGAKPLPEAKRQRGLCSTKLKEVQSGNFWQMLSLQTVTMVTNRRVFFFPLDPGRKKKKQPMAISVCVHILVFVRHYSVCVSGSCFRTAALLLWVMYIPIDFLLKKETTHIFSVLAWCPKWNTSKRKPEEVFS